MVGVNCTEMVHCALGARLVPQLLVCENGADVWMLEMLRVPD